MIKHNLRGPEKLLDVSDGLFYAYMGRRIHYLASGCVGV